MRLRELLGELDVIQESLTARLVARIFQSPSAAGDSGAAEDSRLAGMARRALESILASEQASGDQDGTEHLFTEALTCTLAVENAERMYGCKTEQLRNILRKLPLISVALFETSAEIARVFNVNGTPFIRHSVLHTPETLADALASTRDLEAAIRAFDEEMLPTSMQNAGDNPGSAVPATPTVSMSPELVAKLEAALAGLPAVLDGNRAGLEHGTGAINSLGAREDDHAPAAVKLPNLKPWAMEAWKANLVGMTTTAIASTLAGKYNDPKITQPRVSEQIQRARLHAEASGLAGDAAKALPQVGSRAPARTLDPAAAEQGKRTDGKAHHIREREREKAKDGDDEE